MAETEKISDVVPKSNSTEKFGPSPKEDNAVIQAKQASLQEPARDEDSSAVKGEEIDDEGTLVVQTLDKICLKSNNSSDSTGHAKKI